MALTAELIESLFVRPPFLYPTTADALAAVARGDKGCETIAGFATEADAERFTSDALRLGLAVTRQTFELRGSTIEELVATRRGETWRAQVIEWERATRFAPGFPRSEASDYFRSRALGYTHDQALEVIAQARHYTPVHSRDALFLFLPFAVANQVSSKGKLTGRDQATFAIPHHVGPRKDALECLPRGFAIGRAAFDWKVIYPLVDYIPTQTLVATLSSSTIARSLVSPITFWNGSEWSPKPRSSR